MSRNVVVDLAERSYTIQVGTGLNVSHPFQEKAPTSALIVSDSNVDPLHGDRTQQQLAAAGIRTTRFVVPAGEPSKALQVVQQLYDAAFEVGLDRSSVVVALGGGVVGDLAGFVAATFLRGISFLQAPTSLLAMVDSSVGGKTGVNVRQGKNLIGAFYQPIEVIADLETLDTLPRREYLSGLAEVVKYGIIWDAKFFEQLEADAAALLERDTPTLERVVARCCEIKAEVVARDERESGLRAILNFGHTLAHAVENLAGYGRLLHGEAVSIGMVYATEVSRRELGLPGEHVQRILELLRRLDLPTRLEDDLKIDWDATRAAMQTDKKTIGGIPRFVLTDRLGHAEFGCRIEETVLADAMDLLASR